jgi:hypothetical protein
LGTQVVVRGVLPVRLEILSLISLRCSVPSPVYSPSPSVPTVTPHPLPPLPSPSQPPSLSSHKSQAADPHTVPPPASPRPHHSSSKCTSRPSFVQSSTCPPSAAPRQRTPGPSAWRGRGIWCGPAAGSGRRRRTSPTGWASPRWLRSGRGRLG